MPVNMQLSSKKKVRVGLIAVKNTPAEQEWLLSFLRGVEGEPYRRGRRYDLVWFLNVTPELRWIKANTDARTFVVCMEPKVKYPLNYDISLLQLADVYMGYQNFAGKDYSGSFRPFVFPVFTRERIKHEFARSLEAVWSVPFCIMSTHDPNIRRALAAAAQKHGCLAAGPLFGARFEDKLELQRRSRFELISENDINDYYLSEKIGAALAAGCVPVYYGCTQAKSIVSPDLFVDMHDFSLEGKPPDADAVIAYCMQPGIYEQHITAIQGNALQLLLSTFSIEGCLTDPAQAYIDKLNSDNWRSRTISCASYFWRARSVLASSHRWFVR